MRIPLSAALIRPGTAALAVTACVAGCGGASATGIATKPADRIFRAAGNALQGAKSVHVSGSVSSGRRDRVTVDFNLVPGRGASGRGAVNGASFQLVVLGTTVYLKPSIAFWRQAVRTPSAHLDFGRWLRSPAQDVAALTAFTRVQTYSSILLAQHGPLSKDTAATAEGHEAVAIHDRQRGETLYVARSGKPYPILFVAGPQVRLVFDRYNQPVSLSAPAHATYLPGSA